MTATGRPAPNPHFDGVGRGVGGAGYATANMRYRLLVLDLDGTLLDGRGRVTPRSDAALRAARDAGMKVMIATGRSWIECSHVLNGLHLDQPLIAAGGSLLCECSSGRTIRRSTVQADLVKDVARSFHRHGHLAHLLKDPCAATHDYVVVGEGELDAATKWWFETFPLKVRYARELHEDEHPHDTLRIGTVASSTTLERVATELRDEIGEQICFQHWSAVTANEPTGSGTHLLEVFSPQVNKWSMVQAYCAEAGIQGEEVVAIGDGLNDLQLVRDAGLGIAMGNADPRIAAVADRHTASHHEDGVAEAVERILAGEW